jgi:trafficking protein particle complex subunit 8
MKRSLGLHCTILRINTQASEKDFPVEKSAWLSAGEELANMDNPRDDPKLSPSDVQSLQKFTRDMVTQSIVPHMERCITMWNDQVRRY